MGAPPGGAIIGARCPSHKHFIVPIAIGISLRLEIPIQQVSSIQLEKASHRNQKEFLPQRCTKGSKIIMIWWIK